MHAMQVSHSVTAEEIARELMDEPEFAVDVLAFLAAHQSLAVSKITRGDTGSQYHSTVPAFLRALAASIEKNK